MTRYRIWQLPVNNENVFRHYDSESKIDIGDYVCVWADEIETELKDDVDRSSYCEDLFMRFNIKRPKGYGGRSMSVSDMVEITSDEGEGWTEYYFCDAVGFKRLEDGVVLE